MGAYAATKYNFVFDGKKESIDVQVINNKAYVPLNAVTSSTTGASTTQSALSKTINNVTVKIDEVVQNSDSLKIYVTYVNNSKKEVSTGDSLSKIIAGGKHMNTTSILILKDITIKMLQNQLAILNLV
ncbi:hypothetical protein [Lysinibacillus sp. BSL11]